MPSTSPGDQDHTGHLRRARSATSDQWRAYCSNPQPHLGISGVSGACWPQVLLTCFPSIHGQCHLQFYLLKCLFS